MDPDFNWVIVEVDGKIAAVSPDFNLLADIAGRIARMPAGAVNELSCRKITTPELAELSRRLRWEDLAPFGSEFQKHVWHTLFNLTHSPATTATTSKTPDSSENAAARTAGSTADRTAEATLGAETKEAPIELEDIVPAAWTAKAPKTSKAPKAIAPEHRGGNPFSHLMSYTDFARLCGNEPGARAVAHAVAVNPIALIIPCHLIVPKETIDRIRRIERQVAPTLFSNFLLATSDINFGQYRYGPDLKKSLIIGSF